MSAKRLKFCGSETTLTNLRVISTVALRYIHRSSSYVTSIPIPNGNSTEATCTSIRYVSSLLELESTWQFFL